MSCVRNDSGGIICAHFKIMESSWGLMSGDLNLEKRVEDVAAGFDVLKSASVSFEECLAHSEAPITLPGLEKATPGSG